MNGLDKITNIMKLCQDKSTIKRIKKYVLFPEIWVTKHQKKYRLNWHFASQCGVMQRLKKGKLIGAQGYATYEGLVSCGFKKLR